MYNIIGDLPSQIKDKFCLDLNEEEAVQHIQALIDESVKAMMAVFVEQIHKWAQVKAVQYIMQLHIQLIIITFPLPLQYWRK